MRKSGVSRRVQNATVRGSDDEIAEFVEDMLSQLAIMTSLSPMAKERRQSLKRRISLFKGFADARKRGTSGQ